MIKKEKDNKLTPKGQYLQPLKSQNLSEVNSEGKDLPLMEEEGILEMKKKDV